MFLILKNRLILLSIGFVLLASACNDSDKQEQTSQALKLPITSPIYIDTVNYVNYVAEINSIKNVEIRARVKGYIEQIHVDEGQKVKKGQLLFSLSNQGYKEEVLKANAMLKSAIAEAKSAELNLENIKLLVSKNTVSKTEQDIAEAKLEALYAQIEEAKFHEATTKLQLGYTEIKAPFDGVIDRIPYKVGSLIDEGILLTKISDNQEVFAYFHISEKEYLEFAQNILKDNSDDDKDVTLVLANDTEHPHDGSIETIEGEFDSGVGNIAFRARFPNPELILKNGSSGKVKIRQNLHKVLVIPQKSAFEIQDKIYVYVIDKDNKVKMKSFIPKLRIPHLFVVESGLTTSDKIIYEGIQEVKEGMTVSVEPIAQKDIIAELAKE
ncbi:MAG: efflux RND transporter periplasmic adaptor subunit [Thermoflexibacter sp.]|jgi:membrane fusion protein (multidrug efflux system)|nr:efflux RND transporter periplasmic adaptor subunit [Thermoflexibacter sp.]